MDVIQKHDTLMEEMDMHHIAIEDDWYACTGEFQDEYYSEFNGNIYVYDSEVLLGKINFDYKISRKINNLSPLREDFTFTVESDDIASFTVGYGVISFSDVKSKASFSSLCKIELTTPIDDVAQGRSTDNNEIVRSKLHVELFAGQTPSDSQRERFIEFIGKAENFVARIEDSKNAVYEQSWRFTQGWISTEIERCAANVRQYFDELKSPSTNEGTPSISPKDIELIMQVVPIWVAGGMVQLAKVGASDREFMNWMIAQSVPQTLVSHEEILKVYSVMRSAPKK